MGRKSFAMDRAQFVDREELVTRVLARRKISLADARGLDFTCLALIGDGVHPPPESGNAVDVSHIGKDLVGFWFCF